MKLRGMFTDMNDQMRRAEKSHPVARTLGWISVAAGVVAVSFYVGRQLRAQYNFRRRTPYDFYSHAGDEQSRRGANNNAEYGVGV